MAALQDIEVEGVTAFAPPPATTYHYTITLKDDTLGIFMEDRATKKQWYKGSMDESDYVSAANAVTGATPADYAKCFRDALGCELDRSGDSSRDLEILKEGALRLQFFRPDPSASSKDATSSNLLLQTPSWQKVDSSNFTVDEKLGEVRVCHAGEYSITVVVDASANGYNPVTSLLKNSNVLQNDGCSCVSNRKVYLEQDDVVTVKCDSDVTSACHVSILRLRR
ncbi:hypothetical protein PHYSODRAFT_307216 [Phytophthora sojae]|uniref:Uncharacterized protein n=1 Tax=Phytophthora sojae (strain P6497) TaxID=1094619 RepID=G5ADE0_PHYSP|nr:hypothetical protein PHYSODRAFT_307216 [Phytophthora sojae]EGZ06193.1 hypothetical protein PHYSODRAFT_307216 [Phytophthora sojae]|eukprot:XP_009538090.1 hypothetical protein PHYSODRAFT_307216 [Phytophthora sojae]